MTCHQSVGQADVLSDVPTPPTPSIPPGRSIWWPRVLLAYVQLTWAHILLSAIYHLEFLRVLCKRLFHFSYVAPMPTDTPTPPANPWHPIPPQYRHLVAKSGITAGQHDMSSACGSGWCFVRCTNTTHPLNPPGRGIWWPRVVLTYDQLTWAHVLLSAINHLEFSRVLCKRLSLFFMCSPQCLPKCLYIPCQPPNAPTPSPVQESSGQEWYYCQSAWHVISLWVMLVFCQMYQHHPPPQSTRERHLVAKSGTNLCPVDLSSCSIVCNKPSWIFKSTLQETVFIFHV